MSMMTTWVRLIMVEVRMPVPEITSRGNHGLGPKPISRTLVMILGWCSTWSPADSEWRTGGIQKKEGRGNPLFA